MDKLKPCPFCGGDAALEVFDGRYGPLVYAACEICGASSKHFRIGSKEDPWEGKPARQAAHFWNQRAGE